MSRYVSEGLFDFDDRPAKNTVVKSRASKESDESIILKVLRKGQEMEERMHQAETEYDGLDGF